MTSSRRAAKARLSACLVRHGLTTRGEREAGDWGRGLVAACRELGAAYVLFGHYLAGRPDWIPSSEICALEDLEPGDLGLKVLGPEQQLEAVDGPALEFLFSHLDHRPDHRGWTRDGYRARLRRGFTDSTFSAPAAGDPAAGDPAAGDPETGPAATAMEVMLTVPKAGLADELHSELPHFRALLPALATVAPASGGALKKLFDHLLQDFRDSVAERLSPRQEAEALDRFADDLVDRDLLLTPPVPDLSRHFNGELPDLGVFAAGAGLPIDQWSRQTAGDAMASARRRELARRLHLGLLQQILVAGHVPLEVPWRLQPDGRLLVTGGRFVRLEPAVRPKLWAYLTHLAGHRPEEAFDALPAELRPVAKVADPKAMRLRMRQLVPFRDGGWTERRDTLAELVALHWRLCAEHAMVPSPALAALWSAIYQAARLARTLGVEGDPLRDALEDLRWLAGFRSLRRLSDPRQLGETMESNLNSLMELPQKVDRLLHLVSGEAGNELQLRLKVKTDTASRRGVGTQRAMGLAVLMITVGLLSHELQQMDLWHPWLEPISALLFLGLGICLLRTLTRA